MEGVVLLPSCGYGVLLFHEEELLAGSVKLLLEFGHLVLQHGDDAQAAVHGVLLPGVGLVRDGFYRVLALRWVDVFEDAQDVGDAEELVHVGEAFGLIRGEVGGERAVRGALPALVLARRARRAGVAVAVAAAVA